MGFRYLDSKADMGENIRAARTAVPTVYHFYLLLSTYFSENLTKNLPGNPAATWIPGYVTELLRLMMR